MMDEIQYWKNDDGLYHRLDGPAIIWGDGSQGWYLNGGRHRLDGPAVIWADGDQEWYLNGERHREDGPAVIFADGTQEWFINGKNISSDVVNWVKENIPSDYTQWTDSHKVLFRLRF